MKPFDVNAGLTRTGPAAFGRLCVETIDAITAEHLFLSQPPSGGCVLKPRRAGQHQRAARPAAFGRLCVETTKTHPRVHTDAPAAFGRLCVETLVTTRITTRLISQPPSGGCVLKHHAYLHGDISLLPAAFGRLCVETVVAPLPTAVDWSSRLRAAVC